MRELAEEAIANMPDQFKSQDVIRWSEQRYGKLDDNAKKQLRAYIRGACVEPPPGSRPRWPLEERVLVYLERGRFMRRRSEGAS